MRRLLLLCLFVPSVLAAQRESGGGGRRPGPYDEDTGGPPARRAFGLGVLGYTGGTWQPSGVQLAMLWSLGRSQTSAGAWLALGSFTQDQAVYFGRSQGFFSALGLTVRQPLLTLVEVGSERYPAYIRLEVAADLGWSADFHSPLAQGPWDARAALLGGVSFGSGSPLGQAIYIMFGPAALIGRRATTTYGQFALRFRMPMGRR